MGRRWAWVLAVLLFFFLPSCGGSHEVVGSRPTISAQEIAVDALPDLDPSRTYHLTPGRAEDPVTVLSALWAAGIGPTRAWQPLDDRCFDPVGPRFTVELSRNDARVLAFGFEAGEGRLECASRLTEYVVVE